MLPKIGIHLLLPFLLNVVGVFCDYHDQSLCSRKQGVFKSPPNCNADCKFVVYWSIDGQIVKLFILSRNLIPWSGVRLLDNATNSELVLMSFAFRHFPVRHARLSDDKNLTYIEPSKSMLSRIQLLPASVAYTVTRRLNKVPGKSRCVKLEYFVKGSHLQQLRPGSSIVQMMQDSILHDEIICSECYKVSVSSKLTTSTKRPTTESSPSTTTSMTTTLMVNTAASTAAHTIQLPTSTTPTTKAATLMIETSTSSYSPVTDLNTPLSTYPSSLNDDENLFSGTTLLPTINGTTDSRSIGTRNKSNFEVRPEIETTTKIDQDFAPIDQTDVIVYGTRVNITTRETQKREEKVAENISSYKSKILVELVKTNETVFTHNTTDLNLRKNEEVVEEKVATLKPETVASKIKPEPVDEPNNRENVAEKNILSQVREIRRLHLLAYLMVAVPLIIVLMIIVTILAIV